MVSEVFFQAIRSQFSFSLKCVVCNYFVTFLSAVVSQLPNLPTIMKNIDMGTLWCANFFQRLQRNGSSPLKSVVYNLFVQFFSSSLCKNYRICVL